jgi:hypothetical protein
MERMTIRECAKLMECTEQLLRILLQNEKCPFGYAVKPAGRRWVYYIDRSRLEAWKRGEL